MIGLPGIGRKEQIMIEKSLLITANYALINLSTKTNARGFNLRGHNQICIAGLSPVLCFSRRLGGQRKA